MEVCAGVHHMARMLATFGHRVKLISLQYLRPFVKSNKNDSVDAEEICEAASRRPCGLRRQGLNRNKPYRLGIERVNR